MLITLILIPLITAIFLIPIKKDILVKQITLFSRILTFLISVILWGVFDDNTILYQFTSNKFNIGIDGISLFFLLLTTYTMPINILASWNIKDVKFYMIFFLILERLLILVFVVLDLILFYVFFESVLIPLFLLVGIWGASEFRIRASFLLFLYTLFGSLFMLLAFLYIIKNVGSSNIELLSLIDINFNIQKILWLAIFLSFAIKTPLIPFHLWLIRAHVEAPVGVSMVLAGLVLKLASYGMLRILLPILPEARSYFTPLAITSALISIIYGSLSCLRQTDFKCLVAYSRIAHMGVVILGIFSNTIFGIEGAIILSIAHGFVSPALFFIVGGVLYDRYHTREIKYYRGLTIYMPILMIFFFLFTLANMGTPGISVNWVGEILSLIGIFQENIYITILGRSRIVLSACYSIWLYNRLSFGRWKNYLNYTIDITRREYFVLLSLLIPTILFGLMPNILLKSLHISVRNLIYTI